MAANSYSTLGNTWGGDQIKEYEQRAGSSIENYEAKITIPYNQWRQYVSSGLNTLYGGAIIPGGTGGSMAPGGTGGGNWTQGAVYSGHVRQ